MAGMIAGFFVGPDKHKLEEQMLNLLREGKTFAQISAVMGATRCVLLGRFHRMAKKKPELLALAVANKVRKGARSETTTKVKPVRKPALVVVADHKGVMPFRLDGQLITDMTVRSRMCRYPHGDPTDANYHYCGNTPREGSSYCDPHHALCYTKPEKKVNHLGRKRA